MGIIDPSQEGERLAALYAGMSDLELQKLVEDPDTLTEWARTAARAEMEKRGLPWPESKVRAPGSKPIVLRKYRDITEAMIDKTTLDSAGIDCVLYDDNLVRLDWFISNAIGGVKLVVPEDSAEEAANVLAEAVQMKQSETDEQNLT
jgi:hypothetical protein